MLVLQYEIAQVHGADVAVGMSNGVCVVCQFLCAQGIQSDLNEFRNASRFYTVCCNSRAGVGDQTNKAEEGWKAMSVSRQIESTNAYCRDISSKLPKLR